MREQREELAVTLASIGDAVVVTDAAERVTFMNAAAERLDRLPRRRGAGAAAGRVCSLIGEETRAPVESPVARVIRDGAEWRPARAPCCPADGHERADRRSGPMRDRRGLVVGAVLVLRDLTERRSIERTRRR